MRGFIKISMFVIAMGACKSMMAQQLTAKAYDCYKQKDYACAQNWIDSAIVSNERSNSQTWQLRGVVYRNLETPQSKDYRSIAIESFVQARNLDKDNADKEKIDNYLKNTIIRYYNDAVTALEANDLKESEKSYELYKSKQVQYVNPSQDFHQSDIDFYNALGGQYMNNMSILPEGAQRDEIRAKGIAFFEKVLELDAENFQANFNVGLIHYNEGVDITMAMSGSTDLSIEMIIENTGRSEELFFTALPYLHKAEKMDPKSEETIEGITGCYYGLHDDENYNKYRKILDEMIIDDLLKSYDANPNDLDVVKELCRIYSTTIKNQQEYDKFKAVYDKLREN